MGFLSRATAGSDDDENTLLKRLSSSQIFMICIGGTIGIGFAKSSGEIIAIAGPGGALLAFILVGLVAICVMEGVCEMINLWPISNGMIEFVRNFVDEDLAMVVGFTYWYAYCCALSALVIGAGNILTYFNINHVLLNIVYIGALLGIFLVNCCGVFWFGQIEFYGGILKLMIIGGVFVLMMCINAGVSLDHPAFGATPFVDGVRNNPNVADSHFAAVLTAISLAIFPYIGVELVTVTAFEAADPAKLRWPAKNIAYVITLIYGLIVGGLAANVEWFDSNLPQIYSQDLVNSTTAGIDVLGHSPLANQTLARGTNFAPVIALLEAGVSYKPVASVLLGFLVYSALSCANTNLYVASRTLYGLTRDLSLDGNNFFERLFAHLNQVTPTYRVPLWSIFLSIILCASWLPFVKLGLNQQDLFNIMSSIGSVGVLLVWASQCLAFIRYHKWLAMHKHALKGNHEKFQRWPMKRGFSSYFAAIQPVPAYIGLISCLGIVFIFNSAEMWNGNQLLIKGLNIYLGPAISLLLFLILKIIRWRWRGSGGWVELGDWNKLHSTLDRLDELVIRRTPNLEDAPTSPASIKPSLDEAENGQPFFSAFSGRYPGHSSTGSDGISPLGQDYPNSQRQQDRMSIPLSEIGPVDNEPIGGQRENSYAQPDARTSPFNPQAAYFPPQAPHYAHQTTNEIPQTTHYAHQTTNEIPQSTHYAHQVTNETPQSTYYTPQSTAAYLPTGQQYTYQAYQPYQPDNVIPPTHNQSNQYDQYGQNGQNDQNSQQPQYHHY